MPFIRYAIGAICLALAMFGAKQDLTWLMMLGVVSASSMAIFILITTRTGPVTLNQYCIQYKPDAPVPHGK